jgi:hypothetical protein
VTARAAGIRGLIAAGDRAAAADAAGRLIADGFGQPVAAVELTVDEYSLNSVSGRVRFTDGHTEFFKFHAEEGEERSVAEYYRARLLAAARRSLDAAIGSVMLATLRPRRFPPPRPRSTNSSTTG